MYCAGIVGATLDTKQAEQDQQTARECKRQVNTKADYNSQYTPLYTILDGLILHLNLGGVSCRGRLTRYSY